MEPFYAGWLSLVPPVLAISLALLTKEVISSLMAGILAGTLIYSFGVGANPIVNTVETAFSTMVNRADLYIIIFCCMLGALVAVISLAGGSKAYGHWATTKIRSKRASLLATSALGALIFIDDYFNCLTVGTVMKPVTDKYNVSRAKLAYIIDSTAAPICIIAPISSWAAAVGSNLSATGHFESDFSAFISTIPFNLYALLSLLMVVLLCCTDLDFGPMAHSEQRARKGDLGGTETQSQALAATSDRGTILDMLLPIGALIVFSILGMLYNGGFWGADPAYHSIGAAFGNCTAAPALTWGGFGALLVALVLFVPRKLMGFKEFMSAVGEGIKSMTSACVILLLAWTISGVCSDLLLTADFVRDTVHGSQIPGAFLPALIFMVAAFLSFSTGTAWGTFGILIPIVVPVAFELVPELLVVSLSATLAGSVFGDHCSPISDTTILSSTGAACNHIEHVSTQLPYVLVVASCCVVGYLVAGFSNANVVLTLGVSVVMLIGIVLFLHSRTANASRPTAS